MESILKNKKIMLAAGLALLAIIIAIVVISSSGTSVNDNNQLSLGEKFLQEMDYDNAILAFTKVLKVDPMNTKAYLGLADAYIGNGDIDKAIEALKQGYDKTGNIALKERLDLIISPVQWNDAAFGAMVAKALKKSENEIIGADLLTITTLDVYGNTHAKTNLNQDEWHVKSWGKKEYHINFKKFETSGEIRNLSDLDKFPNLIDLNISYQKALDISELSNREKISCLNNIKSLTLRGNKIKDIKPISFMTSLKNLVLPCNEIKDIKPISFITSLEHLYLNSNEINDITPLTGLTELTRLQLGDNEGIYSSKPLSNLKKIESLSLYNVGGVDIELLSTLPRLKRLCISCIKADYSKLPLLKNVDYLRIESGQQIIQYIAQMKSLTELHIYSCYNEDLSPLSALTGLTKLDIFIDVKEISFIKSLTQIEEIDLWVNKDCDLTPLTSLPKLKKVTCGEDEVSEKLKQLLPNIEVRNIFED